MVSDVVTAESGTIVRYDCEWISPPHIATFKFLNYMLEYTLKHSRSAVRVINAIKAAS
jgi:hypothetical protein